MCIRDSLWKIQALTETNGKLAKDSMDFYTLLLAEAKSKVSVSYTHLRAHETVLDLVCRLLLEKKKTPY